MSKYDGLGNYLRRQGFAEIPMTFAEIERVTGVKLPPKAQHHRAWWSNNPSNNVMTKAWLEAGFESAKVDMKARKLVFRRVANGMIERLTQRAMQPYATKEGRHPLRGALKDITRLVPGV